MTKKEKKKDKQQQKEHEQQQQQNKQKKLPEPLETQRHYVLCGPDQNSHVSQQTGDPAAGNCGSRHTCT